MKFIVIYSPTGISNSPLAAEYEAEDAKQVANELMGQGITSFSIVPADEVRKEVTPISRKAGSSLSYNPDVVATSKLAKVEIAADDYNIGGKEVDGKHYFTFNEAQEVQKTLKDTGWRLPTRSEWTLICEEFGQKDGELDCKTLYKNLNMGHTGWIGEDGNLHNRTTAGTWWSDTASSATHGRYLTTGTGDVYAQNSHFRGNSFALRLVRNVKESE